MANPVSFGTISVHPSRCPLDLDAAELAKFSVFYCMFLFLLWIHPSEPDEGALHIVDMPLLLGLTLNCELVCFYGRVLKTGMSKQTLIASLTNLDDDTDRKKGNFFHPHLICGLFQAPYLDAFAHFRDQVRTAAMEGASKVH
jgi:hypothetical protein